MDIGSLLTWVSLNNVGHLGQKENDAKILVWSEQSHDFRALREEHLSFDANCNEVRIVLDEIHGE